MNRVEQLVLAGTRRSSDTGATFAVHNPTTGVEIAEVAEASALDADRAVAAAVAAQEDWVEWTPSARATVLQRWAELVDDRAEELAVLQTQENGLTIRESRGIVTATSAQLRYSSEAADKVRGETIPTDGQGLLLTRREPLGVVVGITAWNAPVAMAAQKAGPALATGNAVIIKPSELAPLTTLVLADLASEAGLPPGCLSVLTGGPELGAALVEHPGVNGVSFTGSTSAGRDVARRAAATFKRLTLELGGKSAAVVFEDADVDQFTDVGPEAVFGLAGQDCCARSRLLIHDAVYDAVVSGYLRTARGLTVADPMEETTDLGPLITRSQRDRVHEEVGRSVAAGAEVLLGGSWPSTLPASGGWYSPTVLGGVQSHMRVAQRELFGPVVSVLRFSTEDEAVRLANDTEYGLSGSIWTQSLDRALRVSKRIRSGVLSVNSNTSNYLEAPFGGVKQSGIGRVNGLDGLRASTELKTMFLAGR